jgi:thymidylate synthase
MKNANIDPIYSTLIKSLLRSEHISSPRRNPIKELYAVGWLLEDAHNCIILNPLRKMNYAYAVIEMLGNFRDGQENIEPYCWYNPVMKNYINPSTGLWDGSYANRLMRYNQLVNVLKILQGDPDSRRAVIGLYNPAHDFHDYESLDVCCSLNLVFRLRGGTLDGVFTIRSNDILLGVPYDNTQFCFILSVMAKWLGAKMGSYYHFAANLHAYQCDWSKLERIANIQFTKDDNKCPLSSMPDWDISDPQKTYEEIAKFFTVEKKLRDSGNPSFEMAEKYCEEVKMTSNVLKNLLFDVILPFQQRKLKKLQK